jgi:hypothetical protein
LDAIRDPAGVVSRGETNAGGGKAVPRAGRRVDHRLYAIASLAAFTVVVAGFSRTYYLKTLFQTPALPWLLHLHGGLMTGWFVLFFVQTYLIASHRTAIHRRLGVFGSALAALIVIVGATVARRAAARDLHAPTAGPPPLQFMGFILFVLLIFAILVVAALLLRRRADWHKRLMLLSCLAMTGPGLVRLPFQRFPALAFLKSGGPFGLFGLDLLLVYACIAWDTWRNRHVHPAFVLGALLIALEDLPFIGMFLSSPAWMRLAARLVS